MNKLMRSGEAAGCERAIDREINYTLMHGSELAQRRKAGDPFPSVIRSDCQLHIAVGLRLQRRHPAVVDLALVADDQDVDIPSLINLEENKREVLSPPSSATTASARVLAAVRMA